jgi:hypothetical protein
MKYASWRGGVLFAALFMLVSTSVPAFARTFVHEPLSRQNWKVTQQAIPAKGHDRVALHLGDAVVRASWYGGGERLHRHTASGERFDPRARTAAHRTLPLGTKARIVNVSNGRVTLVTINDRGPALWTGRALDLSRQAAIDLGMIHGGEARVAMEILR